MAKVVLCIKIRKDVERALRSSIPAKKGELSKFIEEAIKEKLERMGVVV